MDRAERQARTVDRLIKVAFSKPWTGEAIPGAANRWNTTALTERDRPVSMCLTFDAGYHASGWWANADYDKCLHLSISHPTGTSSVRMVQGQWKTVQDLESPDDAEVWAWAVSFFGEQASMCWIEPPASALDQRRLPNVAHVRLFYRADMERKMFVPIQPTGEVYHLRPIVGSPDKIVDGRLGADVR